MGSSREMQQDTSLKLMGFLLTLAIILILVGLGLRTMFATVDDAAYASMDAVKTAFAERNNAVHVYWINNGKRKTQYLDVSEIGGAGIRIAYEMSETGWPRDARIVTKGVATHGGTPCERIMEMVVPGRSAEVIQKMSSKIFNYEKGCVFIINEDKLKYSFQSGDLSLIDLMPERNEKNIYFK